jgi:phosphate starvation-inducible PhoH-like protein
VARETLTVSDELARELASRSDELLAALSERLDVRAFLRGDQLILDGDDVPMEQARAVVDELEDLVGQGLEIGAQTVDAVSGVLAENGRAVDVLHDVVWRHRGKKIAPKTANQKRYVDSIRRSTITFGIGPAGTGKTYLAIALAVAALVDREVSRIILTRPAVEAGERLGFLPGDIAAKVDPYLRPLFDALMDMLDSDRVQNTTPEQMQMFLTRLGFGSQVVVTGDVTQIDLPRGQGSGLIEVREILKDVPDIEFVLFDRQDVVRHKLVQRIVDAYRIDAERRGDIR